MVAASKLKDRVVGSWSQVDLVVGSLTAIYVVQALLTRGREGSEREAG